MSYFAVGIFFNMAFQGMVLATVVGISKAEIANNIILAHFSMALSLGVVNAKEFAVTFSRSLLQAKDLEKKNKEVSYLNKNLEGLVEKKTGQIRALLDYIPQGILSIEGQGQLSNDYSAHLEDILETNEIAGQKFNELILNHSDLSKDEQDQCWQSIIAMLDQWELAFDANCDKLPAEIPYCKGDHKKILKATWNVKLEDGVIHNVLVTLLDVTNEKALEEVAQAQRSEMKLLTELVSVSESNLAQFFATSSPLIEENLRVLKYGSQSMSDREVRLLFVNAHTVKGAARTLGLKTIANLIHVAEDTYSAIIKNEIGVDIPRMQEEMQAVSEKFKEALEINKDKLNRGNVIENVSVDRSFIEHHHALLRKLIADPNRPVSSFLRDIEKQSAIITDIVFERLNQIMEDYYLRAQKIARDLGKPEPNFEIESNDISISYKLRLVLDNCMTHILRNSLDHGIEDETTRIKCGKPNRGNIKFSAEVKEHSLNLTISDDGRGLSLQKIKKRGLEKAVISENASLEEIAQVIFADQVSTASAITAVSGRGIGMEAVKSYLESIGGRIEILFPEGGTVEDEFIPFALHLTIPLNLEDESVAA